MIAVPIVATLAAALFSAAVWLAKNVSGASRYDPMTLAWMGAAWAIVVLIWLGWWVIG
jgi:hypothetical protein